MRLRCGYRMDTALGVYRRAQRQHDISLARKSTDGNMSTNAYGDSATYIGKTFQGYRLSRPHGLKLEDDSATLQRYARALTKFLNTHITADMLPSRSVQQEAENADHTSYGAAEVLLRVNAFVHSHKELGSLSIAIVPAGLPVSKADSQAHLSMLYYDDEKSHSAASGSEKLVLLTKGKLRMTQLVLRWFHVHFDTAYVPLSVPSHILADWALTWARHSQEISTGTSCAITFAPQWNDGPGATFDLSMPLNELSAAASFGDVFQRIRTVTGFRLDRSCTLQKLAVPIAVSTCDGKVKILKLEAWKYVVSHLATLTNPETAWAPGAAGDLDITLRDALNDTVADERAGDRNDIAAESPAVAEPVSKRRRSTRIVAAALES